MSIYLDEWDTYTRLDEWIDLNSRKGNTKLVEQAFDAYADFAGQLDMDNFIVMQVHGYLVIAHMLNEFNPVEISVVVKPFDEDRIYPLQRIKKEITWD